MSFSITKFFGGKKPTETEITTPPGARRIGDYEAEDLFIIGFPKSGHTWMQNLVAQALFGSDSEPDLPKPISQLVPDIHYVKFFERIQSPMFFKAHALPQPEFKRVIYLLRDGRDVMVSYWHFLQATQKRELDFLTTVTKAEGFFPPCKWHEHVQQWLANPFDAQLLTVRYDELKRNGVAELRRIFAFAGIERTNAQLEHAVAQSSFDNMQQREKKFGRSNPNWPKDKLFVRRGETGSYRDEMPEAVQEAFLKDAAPMMRRLGYLDN
jgi:hypothetical protein